MNPGQVVFWKGSIGAAFSLGVARILGESAPSLSAALVLFVCGAAGYGLSLRLCLAAQRRVGAGRTGSLFAVAPFVGAATAWAMGDRSVGPLGVVAAVLIIFGVYLHLSEEHSHVHTHEPDEHEHAHRHDDGHHDHVHEPAVGMTHNHRHQHEAQRHSHPHAPDMHHKHEHH